MPELAAPATRNTVERKPRRWRRRLVVAAVLLVALVWFAPTLVAKTGLLNAAAGRALADFNGTVRIGGASLGWFSAVELRDVTVADADGRELIVAPSVTSSKSLLGFVRNRTDLGTFTLDRPAVTVVSEGGTTNLERSLEKYLNDSSPSAGRPTVGVRVQNATVTIRDADRKRDWTLTGVEASADISGAESEPIRVAVKADAPDTTKPGQLELEAAVATDGEAKVSAREFPLAAFAFAVQRVRPGTSLAGRLTTDLAAKWATSNGNLTSCAVDGKAEVADLDLSGPRLGSDRLLMARAELPCKLSYDAGVLTVERAEFRSDIGTASFKGVIATAEPIDQLLDRPGLEAKADIDLARVATLLPRLLKIRPGTAIQEGKVRFDLASKTGPAGLEWHGKVETTSLVGTRDGRRIAWEQPLSVVFAGRLGADRLPTFDVLRCQSDFIGLNAKGSVESFALAANVELDRLSARLADFTDIGVALRGKAHAELLTRPTAGGGFEANGKVALSGFEMTDRAGRTVREPQLDITLKAEGHYASGRPVRLDSGAVTVAGGGDALELAVLGPVADLRQITTGGLSAKLGGDFARWRDRAEPFASIPKRYVIGGTGTVAARLTFDPQAVAIEQLAVDLKNARFVGFGVDLDEAELKVLPTNGRFERASRTLTLNRVAVTCPTFGAAAETMRFDLPPAGDVKAAGTMLVNANLNRLQRAVKLQSDPRGGDGWHGMVRGGKVTLDVTGDRVAFRADCPVENFAYGSPQKPAWSETGVVKVVANGVYDGAGDAIRFDELTVDRDGFKGQAKGTIAKLETIQDIDLEGTLAYDLARLEPELKKFLGQGAKVTGHDSRPFKVAGSLGGGLASLSGNASVGWKALRAYGFDIGEADVRAKLDKGVLAIDPIEAKFGGQGTVRLEPTVRFLPAGTELSLAPGQVIDRAKLTPAATADALGYALPAIARSSEAEGLISLDLGDNRVPLADPTKANMAGKLTLHSVQVGPGPVITEIMQLLGARSTKWQLANEQVVPVRVENGRVYHENLTLTADKFTLRTSGSVGVDGSLDLLADVPLPPNVVGQLLKNNPRIREAVESKRLQIPVGGTLSQPRPDAKRFQAAVQDFVRQVAKEAGRDFLGDVLNKGLDKLDKKLPGLTPPAAPKKGP